MNDKVRRRRLRAEGCDWAGIWQVYYNDIDFVVPAGWLKSVPDKGTICLHYCRERATCRRLQAAFRQGGWPPDFHEVRCARRCKAEGRALLWFHSRS